MANKKKSAQSSDLRQRTHESVDKIMDRAEMMRDGSKEKLSQLRETATTMKDNVDSYIKRNPEKAVLIAAGVGAVAGAMFAAAMMRRKQ